MGQPRGAHAVVPPSRHLPSPCEIHDRRRGAAECTRLAHEIPALAFGRLRFGRDPGYPAGALELKRQAHAIGAFVSRPEVARHLHLVAPKAPHLRNVAQVGPITVESVRMARRVAPDGHTLFDLVGEVTQTCTVTIGGTPFEFTGRCTLILGTEGEVRSAIYRRLDGLKRQQRPHAAITGSLRPFWMKSGRRMVPRPGMLQRLHGVAT